VPGVALPNVGVRVKPPQTFKVTGATAWQLFPSEEVAVSVNVNFPEAVGVPLRAPEEESVKPAGIEPVELHVAPAVNGDTKS